MSPADRTGAIRMSRVAILIPEEHVRAGLVEVAGAGCVDLDEVGATPEDAISEALRRLPSGEGDAPSAVTRAAVDPAELEHDGRRELLAGEQQLHRLAAGGVHRDGVAAWLGWM